jgi:ADP-ribose pyrophosphatase
MRKKKRSEVRVLSGKDVFRGHVFKVRCEHVVEPNGIEASREIVVHPGSVVVLPAFPDGRILLIRQYRHAAGQYLWELVAGRKDDGETFEDGARRELKEETGYDASEVTPLLHVFPSPGFVTEQMVIFLAKGLKKGAPRPEDDEKIQQRTFTLTNALEWICSGKICDAKSVAGILYYARFSAPRGK